MMAVPMVKPTPTPEPSYAAIIAAISARDERTLDSLIDSEPQRGRPTMETQTHTLETPDVDLVYDVHGPSPTAGGRPPLLMAGHPMDASGFDTLASYFSDRTVVTYDPRGIGRSIRKDGRDDRTPELHAADLHALITALGVGPVDVFASSGGAVNALALVAEHPGDVALSWPTNRPC
jgi:hypothetical protein